MICEWVRVKVYWIDELEIVERVGIRHPFIPFCQAFGNGPLRNCVSHIQESWGNFKESLWIPRSSSNLTMSCQPWLFENTRNGNDRGSRINQPNALSDELATSVSTVGPTRIKLILCQMSQISPSAETIRRGEIPTRSRSWATASSSQSFHREQPVLSTYEFASIHAHKINLTGNHISQHLGKDLEAKRSIKGLKWL